MQDFTTKAIAAGGVGFSAGSSPQGADGVAMTPFELAVSMGRVPGYSWFDKFGKTDVATVGTDIWEAGTEIPDDEFGTAPITSVGSTDAADTQDIEVYGLDIDGNEVTQTVTLQGNTRVVLPTPLWICMRMENDGSTDFTGTVYAYTGILGVPSANNDPRVRNLIVNGNNQTLYAAVVVPKDKVFFLRKGRITILYEGGGFFSSDQGTQLYYRSKRPGKVYKVKDTPSLVTGGNSLITDLRPNWDIIPELTKVKITVATSSTADMGISATLTFLVVDADKLNAGILAALGMS